jgi:hypothetical protein
MSFGKDVIYVLLLRGSLYEDWQSNMTDTSQFRYFGMAIFVPNVNNSIRTSKVGIFV